MSRENVIWLILFILGGLFLGGRLFLSEYGMGKAYVKADVRQFAEIDVTADDGTVERKWVAIGSDEATGVDFAALPPDQKKEWTTYAKATFGQYLEQQAAPPPDPLYSFSLIRSIGIWVAATFTLFVMTFLVKDNPFYKIAESVFVGVSAAYWMVVAFWDTLVPNLIGKLSPDLIRGWAMPGLGADERVEWLYLVPLALGVMLLWRLSPKGGWISRWPMAFIIGVFCGLRLVTFLQADFLSQIRNGIVPLWVTEASGAFDFWGSLKSVFLVVGVLACLVYFFFSIEHRGMVGHTARLGIFYLMITFGAAFGYTVMGRIALLAIRIEFLFDDWLWLIDPTGRRDVESVAVLVSPAMSAFGFA